MRSHNNDLRYNPTYGYDSISGVMPSALGALGIDYTNALNLNSLQAAKKHGLPSASRVCVVLADGLGYNNLVDRLDKTSLLKDLINDKESSEKITTSFPSTTASALAALGTGTCPGMTGFLGYSQFDPKKNLLMNMLNWRNGENPGKLQKQPTVFEVLRKYKINGYNVGLKNFKTSGLTKGAFRSGKLITNPGNGDLSHRIYLALKCIKRAKFTYLYIGEIDRTGHKHGWKSSQWNNALTEVDKQLNRLFTAAPKNTLFILTADHGMIDGDRENYIDVANISELSDNTRVVAGEPRLTYIYANEPDKVCKEWQDYLGDRAYVYTKEEAIESGKFGKVLANVRRYIGDVIVETRGRNLIVDMRTEKSTVLNMVGYHGSTTKYEFEIPYIKYVS